MQHIETIKGLPEIGQTYLVRCARLPKPGYSLSEEDLSEERYVWRPTLGKAHEDTEWLNVNWHHYHYDFRFLTDEDMRQIASHWRGASASLDEVISSMFTLVIAKKFVKGTLEYRPMVCHRQMPEFPVVRERGSMTTLLWDGFTRKLEEPLIRKGAKLRTQHDCLRCPHRNIPLSGIPNDGETIVCPAHGLRWNLKTGKIVSRENEYKSQQAARERAKEEKALKRRKWPRRSTTSSTPSGTCDGICVTRRSLRPN